MAPAKKHTVVILRVGEPVYFIFNHFVLFFFLVWQEQEAGRSPEVVFFFLGTSSVVHFVETVAAIKGF